jgi:Domain of unknown function (DUF4124)
MRLLIAFFALVPALAAAQVYRWVDTAGTVHYSNEAPPPDVKATKIDIDARPGPPSPDTQDCYTVRCQGERMEARLAQREIAESRAAVERAASAPYRPHGLEFRSYISIQRGMSEGELIVIAGAPDLLFLDRFLKTYTYLPTSSDPFTTTITLLSGRVSDIERMRRF